MVELGKVRRARPDQAPSGSVGTVVMSVESAAPERIVIVGGVAGGASAAARARRVNETARIVVFERDAYISFANCRRRSPRGTPHPSARGNGVGVDDL